MQEQLFLEYYAKRGFSDEEAKSGVETVKALENADTATLAEIRNHLNQLISRKENTLTRLLALARYFYITGRNDIYIYFTSLLGGLGVMSSIHERLKDVVGEALSTEIMASLNEPPLGTDIQDYPAFTHEFVMALEAHLPKETCHKVLAGNNHQIPVAHFLDEKEIFERLGSMDAYLEDLNRRQIGILQKHSDEGTVWFEQTITQDVVDFVSQNQEIMSAVHRGDWIYSTKIPYDPDRWLHSQDPDERRYLACHCPFVREAIRTHSIQFSDTWCSCSAGFAKHPYEVILGRPLQVETLSSVLKGDEVCRFRIYVGA